jgi:UDP-GlcNAc:undecaprenyl-phosphate GlcNAc-1-phosphate transferase
MLKYLLLFLLAAVVSYLFTPVVRYVARRLGALDLPGERKVHEKPIPRLGGFGIFVSFNLILLITYKIDFFYFPPNFMREIRFGWLFVASEIILGLGAVDDIRRMPPSIKFFFQIIAGLIVALTCFKMEVISSPFGTISLGILSIPATVLWVVAITNAINLLDGLDGLAAGTSFIVCLAMFGVSLLSQNIGIALITAIMAGSILGFLRYNFHPASIFLGDSGAYYLGFFLSVVSLSSNLKGPTTFAILVPIIALGLPIMDTVLSMLRRLMTSMHIVEEDKEENMLKFLIFRGRSIVKADRDHIHHRLLQMGFTQRNAVIILYGVTFLLGGVALSSLYFKNINQALVISTIAIASYVGVRKLGYSEIQFLGNGTLLPLFDSSLISRRIFRVLGDVVFIALAYYFAMLLRFEGEFLPSTKEYYLSTIPVVLSVKIVVFYFVGLYKGPWRYLNVDDFLRMLKAVMLGCAITALIVWAIPPLGVLSWSVLIIDFNLLFLLIAGSRSSFRILEYLHFSRYRLGRKVLIYGVGKGSAHFVNELINNPRLKFNPVGFIDDDGKNKGAQINSYPVLGTLDSLEGILESHPVSEVIVSRDDISQDKLERLSEICGSRQISLLRLKTRLEEISPKKNGSIERKTGSAEQRA